MTVRRHTPLGMSDSEGGSLLPQGSGDGQSPEEIEYAAGRVYDRRIDAFRSLLAVNGFAKPAKARRRFHDYTAKNCEECWASGR